MKVAEDTYVVTFEALEFTEAETVQTYLMYRCAELTVEKGFGYFVKTDQENRSMPGPIMGGQTVAPIYSATIKMFPSKPDVLEALDAREVMKNLASKIKR
jgi:hypothetical protein